MKDLYRKMEEIKNLSESLLEDVSGMIIDKECELRDYEALYGCKGFDDEDELNKLYDEFQELNDMQDYIDDFVRNIESSCENNIFL